MASLTAEGPPVLGTKDTLSQPQAQWPKGMAKGGTACCP